MALDWDSLLRPSLPGRPGVARPASGVSRIGAPSSTYGPSASTGSGVYGRGATIGGVPPSDKQREQEELRRAILTAERRMATDPLAAGERDRLMAELKKLTEGKSSGSGVVGELGEAAGKGLQGLAYLLSRPLAVTTSVAKELTDVATGGGASFKDLVSQSFAADTTPSKYIAKTGNKRLDQIIGFVSDVAADPLTYVTFGASAYASRAGRLALASKAAEREILEKAPSLAAKVADGSIARLGEWALNDAEREVLGIQKGLSWTFGGGKKIGAEGTLLGKASAKTAEAVGKPLARARATIGDIEALAPIQRTVASKSVKASGLTRYGRGTDKLNTTLSETIGKLGTYSAAMRGKSMGGVWLRLISDDKDKTLKEVVQYEQTTGRKLVDVIEQVRPAFDQAEADLAQRYRAFLDRARAEANNVTSQFSRRRGVTTYDIGHRENYVPHVITPEAKEYIAGLKGGRSPWAKEISDMLDVDLQEYLAGPGTMRARKLSTGEKWLGETLETDVGDGAAAMAEINRISREKLGFEWFETDAATYMNSYLNSLASQVKRVGFVDRLYDYGDDVVRKLEFELIPDREVIKELRATVRSLNKASLALGAEMAKGGEQLQSIGRRQRNVAERLIRRNAGDPLLSDIELTRISNSVKDARSAFNKAKAAARKRGKQIEADFDTIAAPQKAKLDALEEALATNRQDEVIAILELEDLHVKTFPNAKRRPTTPIELAEQIVNKTQSRTDQKIRALTTRRDRLIRSVSTRGKAGRGLVEAETNYDTVMAEVAEIDREIADLTEVFERTSTDFPDGIALVRRSDVDVDTGEVRSGGVDMFQAVPAGESLDDFVPVYAPSGAMPGEPGLGAKILKPMDDGEDFLDFVDGLGTGVGAALFDLGDTQTAEYFGEMWDTIIRGEGGAGAIDPSFAAAEPELANILARVDKMARRNFDEMEPADFVALFDNDMETIATMLDGWLTRNAAETPGFPEGTFSDGVEMLRHALGNIGDARGGFSEIIGVDLSDIPLFGGRSGIVVNSQYLQNTLRALPEDSAVGRMIRQAAETGEDIPDLSRALMEAGERGALTGSMRATAEEALGTAQQEVAERQARAASAGRAIGGVKSAQKRLEGKVGGLVETSQRTAKEIAEAEAELPKVQRNLAKAERDMARAMRSDPILKAKDEAEKNLGTVVAQFDAAKAARGQRQQWEKTYGKAYRNEVDDLKKILAERPPDGSPGEMVAEWNRRVASTLQALESAPLEPTQKDAISRILRQQQGLEAQLAKIEDQRVLSQGALDMALGGYGGRMVAQTLDGWEAIESLGVQMPPEIRDMVFNRVRDLSKPSEFNKFRRAYNDYVNFFKVTAMLSPGFIVRNAYTAAFNNFVAGVALSDQRAAIRFARNIMKNGTEAAFNAVPQAERALYEQAYQAVVATGSGMTSDLIVQPVTGGVSKKLLDTKIVKGWAKRNEATEVSARMALALSSVRKGLEFDDVVNQVRRYHFDYSDVSSLDDFARNFIPFWIFATRNIPLQLVNQVARPSMYRAYESAQRNFPPDDETILPQWLAERRPLGANALLPFLPKGSVIDPDLPQVDMAQQVSMFSDPMRLLSQANPLVKLPVELMGGRQLYQNIPFKEEKSEIRGPLDLPAYLTGLLTGSSGQRPDGSRFTTSRVAYAVPNVLPTLAQLQRLLPQLGGKESYMDRQTSSVFGYFGLPYRKVSQSEQFNELTRRQFAISNYLSELTRRGYLTPKEQ